VWVGGRKHAALPLGAMRASLSVSPLRRDAKGENAKEGLRSDATTTRRQVITKVIAPPFESQYCQNVKFVVADCKDQGDECKIPTLIRAGTFGNAVGSKDRRAWPAAM